jgi:hypothetical protein
MVLQSNDKLVYSDTVTQTKNSMPVMESALFVQDGLTPLL